MGKREKYVTADAGAKDGMPRSYI